MAIQDDKSVANRLFVRLFQASTILQKQTVGQVGLSTVQWAVLGALSRKGYEDGISFNQLTEYLIVSRQNLDGEDVLIMSLQTLGSGGDEQLVRRTVAKDASTAEVRGTVLAMAGVLGVAVPTLCQALSASSERVYGPW